MIQANNAPAATIRLVVVARHRLDGDALAALFATNADFRVVCTTTSVTVASLVGRHRRPEIVLLDGGLLSCNPVEAPHHAHWIDAVIAQLAPTPILVLADEADGGLLTSMLHTRNLDYCTRSAPFAELAESVRRVATGERAFDSAANNVVHNPPHARQFQAESEGPDLGLLTPREMEVLTLIAQGNTVKHCAELLALAPSTVDNHKSRLMKKLGVHKSLELTRLAIRAGLVSL